MRSGWLVLVLCFAPSIASADWVEVKGVVLEGTIESISDEKVVIDTIYGSGDLKIDTEDIVSIESDEPFHVYTREGSSEVGHVVAVTTSAITLAREDGSRIDVPFDDVDGSSRTASGDASWFERQQAANPFWHRTVELSFAGTQATVDTVALSAAVGFERDRGPSHLRFGSSYVRRTSQDTTADPPDDREVVGANQLTGFVRQEYDLTERIFGLGVLDAEHDGVEALAIRLIPRTGLGYKLMDDEDASLSVEGGVAYVYERFYDDSKNSFPAAGLGFEAEFELPWADAEWFARAVYLAAVEDWLDSYRLHAETGVLLPVTDHLSLKLSLQDDYNSEPAEDTRPNSLLFEAGLSLAY